MPTTTYVDSNDGVSPCPFLHKYRIVPQGDITIENTIDNYSIGCIKREQSAGFSPVFRIEYYVHETLPRYNPMTEQTEQYSLTKPVTIGWMPTFEVAVDLLLQKYQADKDYQNALEDLNSSAIDEYVDTQNPDW